MGRKLTPLMRRKAGKEIRRTRLENRWMCRMQAKQRASPDQVIMLPSLARNLVVPRLFYE